MWEAAQAAAHFDLGNICAIVDRNQMGLDGFTEDVMTIEPIAGRFAAFGWDVVPVDGHDPASLLATFNSLPPATGDTPTCVIANTVKGKGVSYMELSRTWHLGYLAPSDAEATLKELEPSLTEPYLAPIPSDPASWDLSDIREAESLLRRGRGAGGARRQPTRGSWC